jgi:hypothetical protein
MTVGQFNFCLLGCSSIVFQSNFIEGSSMKTGLASDCSDLLMTGTDTLNSQAHFVIFWIFFPLQSIWFQVTSKQTLCSLALMD